MEIIETPAPRKNRLPRPALPCRANSKPCPALQKLTKPAECSGAKLTVNFVWTFLLLCSAGGVVNASVALKMFALISKARIWTRQCTYLYRSFTILTAVPNLRVSPVKKELRGRMSGLNRLLNILLFATHFTNWQEIPVRPDQFATSRESVVGLHLLNSTGQMSAH